MTTHNATDFKIWYREDLLNLLRGLSLVSLTLNEQQRIGFDMAIASIALSIGIDAEVIHERRTTTTVLR